MFFKTNLYAILFKSKVVGAPAMKTLCIDARMAFSSGIGTCIRQLVPYFNQPPFRVILLVGKKAQVWCDGIEQIHFSSPIYSVKEQISFPLKIPSCDLFWSPHYNIPLLPIRAKKRIVTIHDACHLALGQFFSKMERFYARTVMHAALHRSDRVVTGSLFSKIELLRFLGKPKRDLKVIPIGVNRDRFRQVAEPFVIEKVRRKYQLPEKFILYVGNLKPHKNLSGLLQAFERLSLPDLGLVLVGKNQGLRNSIGNISANRVFELGEIPEEDLPVLYSLAELFVFPSFYEGFGLPPLEAMCCGCPTVVSNAASLPEVCGDASLYFRPEQPHEIAESIFKVLSDDILREKIIRTGFERVDRFNWAETARKYREMFEEIAYA